jgi:hypothetical protein
MNRLASVEQHHPAYVIELTDKQPHFDGDRPHA